MAQLGQWLHKCHDSLKNEFFKRTKNELKKMNDIYIKTVQNVIKSNTYNEFELFELKNLKKQNKIYENQLQKQKIQEITFSNSWKVTKPLRKTKKFVKKS